MVDGLSFSVIWINYLSFCNRSPDAWNQLLNTLCTNCNNKYWLKYIFYWYYTSFTQILIIYVKKQTLFLFWLFIPKMVYAWGRILKFSILATTDFGNDRLLEGRYNNILKSSNLMTASSWLKMIVLRLFLKCHYVGQSVHSFLMRHMSISGRI
jgi:hypothetical protein